MRIKEVITQPNWILTIVSDDGTIGDFDLSPYLNFEAFEPLHSLEEFKKVSSGGYFIEWDCGADLSADTIEAHWQIKGVVQKTYA